LRGAGAFGHGGLGGGGGKESQAGPFAAYAAIVAQRTKRPARIVLSKDDDMRITGKRHPFQTFYEVGFDEEGKIIALSVELFADGGAYCDLSSSILERAVFHADGCYFIPNVKITGAVCRTNTASNTAFRGFGGPQGNLVAENVIQEIAQFLRKDAFSIRELNLYSQKRGERTHYEQFIEHNFLPQIFSQIRKDSDYDQRCLEIETFNRKSPKKVRGIAVSGVKFGIAFTARFLNQASALVNWHLDGSVQVSTAATEMGQGVNTKIAQAVAEALGIDFQQVKVMATSTEKTHNTSPTAASSGSDLNCGAALKACDVLKLRLVGVAEKMLQNEPIDPHHDLEIDTLKQADLKKWRFADQKVTAVSSGESVAIKDVLAMAYQNRISLGAQAHFKTEGLGFDKKIWRGKAFNYFTMGAAVSEVEVDRDTGEVKILRVDILMDIGRSMNPGIDRGQVTGGFVQGMGWLTTEKIVHNQDGRVLTFSPTTYKIPNIQDTPRVFNVRFIENHTTQNVYGSKAVGEPPLLLGTSVWLAIKDALHRVNPANVVDIQAPATGEVVLLALEGLKQGGV
jgi:xanthine dehydrogenase large subunit